MTSEKDVEEFRQYVGENFKRMNSNELLQKALNYLGLEENVENLKRAFYLVSEVEKEEIRKSALIGAIPAVMMRNSSKSLGRNLLETYNI